MSPESRYDAYKGRCPPQYDEPDHEVDCMEAPLSALLRAVGEVCEEHGLARDLIVLDLLLYLQNALVVANRRSVPLNDEEWAAHQEELRDSDPRIP